MVVYMNIVLVIVLHGDQWEPVPSNPALCMAEAHVRPWGCVQVLLGGLPNHDQYVWPQVSLVRCQKAWLMGLRPVVEEVCL